MRLNWSQKVANYEQLEYLSDPLNWPKTGPEPIKENSSVIYSMLNFNHSENLNTVTLIF